jgi:tetratricopeptide (TPR) repeat protein
MRLEYALGVYGTQMFTIRREQGRLAEVAPIFKRFVDENPHETTWKPGLALVASDLGFIEPARKAIDELAAVGFAVPYDSTRSTTLAYLAEVCARLDDRHRAASLYELLLPYNELTITMGPATVCYGAAARYLGLLATALDDWKTAVAHFDSAIAINTQMRALPWLAHSQTDYAAMLKKREDRRDNQRIDGLLDAAWSAAKQYGMLALKNRIEGLKQE